MFHVKTIPVPSYEPQQPQQPQQAVTKKKSVRKQSTRYAARSTKNHFRNKIEDNKMSNFL